MQLTIVDDKVTNQVGVSSVRQLENSCAPVLASEQLVQNFVSVLAVSSQSANNMDFSIRMESIAMCSINTTTKAPPTPLPLNRIIPEHFLVFLLLEYETNPLACG